MELFLADTLIGRRYCVTQYYELHKCQHLGLVNARFLLTTIRCVTQLYFYLTYLRDFT